MTDGAQAKKKHTRVRFYRMRNRLKDKAGGIGAGGMGAGGMGAGGGGTIAADALAAAEAEFEKMAEDYPDWVQSFIDELNTHHRRCVDTPEERLQHFKRVNELAHDLRGQGGTFGYPLISYFGDSLFQMSKTETIGDSHVEILKAHIDAMGAVIKGRVNGDGGELGQELRKSLQQAIEKHSVVD